MMYDSQGKSYDLFNKRITFDNQTCEIIIELNFNPTVKNLELFGQ